MDSNIWSSPEELPRLFHYMTSNTVAGFDNAEYNSGSNHLYPPTTTTTAATIPSPDLELAKLLQGTEAAPFKRNADSSAVCLPKSSVPVVDSLRLHSISISLPSSPAGFHLDQSKGVFYNNANSGTPSLLANSFSSNKKQPKQARFHSQPIPAGTAYAMAVAEGRVPNNSEQQRSSLRNNKLKDKRYDSFKTWSGKLEKQISYLRGMQQEPESEVYDSQNTEVDTLPVDRYFDALEGPELETLRPAEELMLPEDKKWPFLLRFPISSFGICLGIGSQAMLLKTLTTSPSMGFLRITPTINVILWCISVAVIAILSFIYSLKIIFYFEAVRREFYHPIRVNFFFAPWIALLFLVLGVPPLLAKNLDTSLWYVLMAPILSLELKIYGQWMLGGQRRLSKVANPLNHLSIAGNFVGALLGASMGLKEGPIFFFAVGLAHYMVLFVTLYQRLPTNETLPKELHPVFFLFVAAPSAASMAWARIQGDFDYSSRIVYFIALFLYFSLVVRINFFRGFRFSLAWWAYTFPMTGASIATISYSNEVKNPLTQTLSIILSVISTLTVTAVLISTLVHAFVFRDLFPNDIAIAITEKRPKGSKRHLHLRSASSDAKEIETFVEMV